MKLKITKKSSRLLKKNNLDYKEMNEGKKLIINAGTSEVAKHIQSEDHKKEDIQYEIIEKGSNWYKRGIKEAIEIRKRTPTLNADEGRYHLSHIWSKTLKRQSEKPLQRTLITNPKNTNEHLLMTI